MEKLQGIPQVLQYDIIEKEIPKVPDEVDKVTGESNPNFIYTETGQADIIEEVIEDVLSDEEMPEDVLPEFVPKPSPPTTIFADEPVKIKPVLKDEVAPSGKINKNGKPRKKRKPMSDHQKEMLKQAREKAHAKRKYLSEQKKKVNGLNKEKDEITKSLKQEKESLETDVLAQEVESLRKKVSKPEPEKEQLPRPPTPVHDARGYITRDDLEKAQLATLVHYESMRKTRKQEKKKKLQELDYMNQVKNTMKAVNGWQAQAGPYAGFF